jgi:hypothetical protein
MEKWFQNFLQKITVPVKKAIQKTLSGKDDGNDRFDHPYIIF